MNKPTQPSMQPHLVFTVLIVALFLITSSGFAQVPGPLGAATGPSEGAQANQLPLSGRTGQSGSVRATQLPVPGTTTSVDTINPTVQVQGPYNGSARSPANVLRSGMLSFREAIQLGLEYNLGMVDQMQAIRQARGQRIAVRSTLLPN